jgi:hypothetical protein
MVWTDKDGLINQINQIPEFVFREVAANPDPGAPPVVRGPVQWEPIPYSNSRCITETGKFKPLAFTSGRYTLIQFKDSFLPLVDQDCEGRVTYDAGFAVMDMFPSDAQFATADGSRIGITAYNSVTKTSALIMKFSLRTGNGRVMTLPKNISGFYKAHVGKNVAQQTANYQQLVSKVQTVWAQIIHDFTNIQITVDNFDDFTKQFDTDPRILKKVKDEITAGAAFNLWSLTVRVYDDMEAAYSKTDITRRKRLDQFVESITSWGALLTL